MKHYAKKILSITSSLLIAAQQSFIAMPVTAVDYQSEAENYAKQIGLELNSKEAETVLSDLIDLNDDELAVKIDDNNNVIQVNGTLSDDTVDNSNDAKDIIAKASELLGIDNVNRELRLDNVSESEYNRLYTFSQYYQGIEMINSCVTVVVDKKTGQADFLNSSVVSDISVNTVPSVTAQQAIDAVAAKYGDTVCKYHKLVIFSEDNESFNLAWAIDTESSGTIYVDAATSEILRGVVIDQDIQQGYETPTVLIKQNNLLLNKKNPIRAYLDNENELKPIPFTIDIKKEDGKYLLHDTKRKIYISSNHSFTVNSVNSTYMPYQRYIVSSSDEKFLTEEIIDEQLTYNSDFLQISAGILNNAERSYDFFANNLGYTPNGDIFIIPDLKSAEGGKFDNAFSSSDRDTITLCFGEGDDDDIQSYGSDIDVVCHEYAHGVTNRKLKWSGSTGETFALNEAYSDIFGEYCDDTREWQHGTDHFRSNKNKYTSEDKDKCVRDLKKENYVPYDEETYRHLNGHAGSRIISHVAYLMHRYGIEDNDGMKLWFASLDYLPIGADKAKFIDCKTALLKAADDVYTDRKKRENAKACIMVAFNRVNIDRDKDLGDVDLDGDIDILDLTYLQNILLGRIKPNGIQKAKADVNFDGKITDEDAAQLSEFLVGTRDQFTPKIK